MEQVVATIDIETNGLLADMLDYSQMPYKLKGDAKIWVVSITYLNPFVTKTFVLDEITKENIAEALDGVDILVAHNGIKFDFVVLWLFGLIDYKIGYLGDLDELNGRQVRLVDTLILSRLISPDRLGGHSLESWGKRVGVEKTDYRGELINLGALDRNAPKGFEFSFYHELMSSYCNQDTITNAYTYVELLKEYKGYTTASKAIRLEHKLADLAVRRENLGFWFDKDLALKNIEELSQIMGDIQSRVNPLLPKKPFTQTELDYYTPTSKKVKQDGSLTSHFENFCKKLDITDINVEHNYFIYKGSIYPMNHTLPLEKERDATVDDLDTVKGFLLELGWNPSEWGERDLTKDAKKQTLTIDKRLKALERYCKDTLEGNKYKQERLSILGVTEETMFSKLKSMLTERSLRVPTTPKIRVGVTKELCPKLLELGDTVSFAKDVADYYTYRHRKSAIAGGDVEDMNFDSEVPNTGYLSQYREVDGRIPTPAIEIGANTFRYRHIGVANVPRSSSLFGDKMRALFGAGKDFVQFGFDYASLEARIQGNFVFNYEGGQSLAESLLAEKPNDIHCYSQDTEILTEEGWKIFGDVTEKIKVAQYNLENKQIEMVYPTEVVWQEYKGSMVNIKNRNTEQLVTPNHRVLSFTASDNPVVDLAEDLKPLYERFIKTSAVLFDGDNKVDNNFLKLLVAVQADGYLSKDCSAVVLSFTRKDKVERLRKILDDLGWYYTEKIYSRKNKDEFIIRLNSADNTKKLRQWLSEDKHFQYNLLELPLNQRLLIIDEIQYWDGTVTKNGDVVLDQVDSKSIDLIQALCSMSGKKSIITQYVKKTAYGVCHIHRIYISNNSAPVAKLNRCTITREDYSGYIGCVAVPSTFIVVRRKGKVFISGNTITGVKMGVPRDQAKSVNYAILYGASAGKFVKMLGMTRQEAEEFYQNYWDTMLPLKQLKEDKEKEWVASGKKFVQTLDGRRVNIRSQHSILNALFQSAGVIFAKYVTVILSEKLERLGYSIDVFKSKPDIAELISYHDEAQLGVNKDLLSFKVFNTKEEAEKFSNEWKGEQLGAIQEGINNKFYITLPSVISKTLTETIKEVEEMFNMNVTMGFEYVTGRNWANCH